MKIDVGKMVDHFSEFSIFDHSAIALWTILGVSAAITLVHTYQEWRGPGGPLWRNFGAIVGVLVPDWLGFPFFFLILTAALWLLAFVAVTVSLLICPVEEKYAVFALGALIGARAGDTFISHLRPYVLRYRPNPGLSSTTLYVLEAVFLVVTFFRGLTADGAFACLGLAIGALFFCTVLPLLRCLRIVKRWRRDEWRPGVPFSLWSGNSYGGSELLTN